MAEQGYGNPTPQGMSMSEFFQEIDEIRNNIDQIKSNIGNIESLHVGALNDIDETNLQETERRLEALSSETSQLNNQTANRIRALKTKALRNQKFKEQSDNMDRQFKDALRNYQTVEKTYADRTRDQMARQFRIVRPDATEEEVRQACEDGSGQQIFSQEVRESWPFILN